MVVWQLLTRVIAPSAAPSVFTGVQLALIYSWLATLGSEYLMASGKGIGNTLIDGREHFLMDLVLFGVVVIGLVGYALNAVTAALERHLLAWRDRTFRALLIFLERHTMAHAGTLDIRGLNKQYEVKGQPLPVLQDIHLTIEPGEFVSIVGTSGCGKSTLLRLVIGLEEGYLKARSCSTVRASGARTSTAASCSRSTACSPG